MSLGGQHGRRPAGGVVEKTGEGEPVMVDSVSGMPASYQALARCAWVPETRPGDGPANTSKFGGTPWLGRGESWPRCGHCGQPMALFLQICGRELPSDTADSLRLDPNDVLQIFYCINDEPCCWVECQSAYGPGPGNRARLIHPRSRPRELSARAARCSLPARRIVGWKCRADYPDWIDYAAASGLDPDVPDSEDVQQVMEGDLDYPLAGDKLGGWPKRIQEPDCPLCPKCRRAMDYLLQIDSRDNLPYEFGDCGCSRLFRCPRHRRELALMWDCY